MVSSIQDMKRYQIHFELMSIAKCVKLRGLAETVPMDADERLSLPAIIVQQAGKVRSRAKLSNNFDELLAQVPGRQREVFVLCWEAIELEVEEDIVEWSERVGSAAVYKTIMSLANEILHS